MTSRPIIFDAESVRAILAGRKTQTRRVVKPQPPARWDCHEMTTTGARWAYQIPSFDWHDARCPYGALGDVLWSWESVRYSIGRLRFRVTDVRVERVQDISEADAIAEGVMREDVCPGGFDPDGFHPPGAYGYVSGLHPFPEGLIYVKAADAFAERWDSLNAKSGFGWDLNPWVWVISFVRN